MRKLFLILNWLFVSVVFVTAQTPEPQVEKPTVESVEIAGVSENRVSRELRDFMQELVGKQFNQSFADEVAFHIQNELKERITAIRQLPGTQENRIKLVFDFGKINIDQESESNVNSRYIVEDVELRGISESSLSSNLVEDMHKLKGDRLDQDRAGEIQQRLSRELRPSHVVTRRVVRGADRTHVRILFEVERAPLLEFRRSRNYLIGHSKQSVSFGAELSFEKRNNRFQFGIVNDGDNLLERYDGFHLTFENIKAGTEHLGFRLEYFNYRTRWKAATELASQDISDSSPFYRERRGVEPTITFGFDPGVRVTIGASVSELQMQYPEIHFQNANAGLASVTYTDRWRSGGADHRLSASYLARTGSRSLDSDFVYTRHLGEVRYVFAPGRSEVVVTATAGLISGNAPLFERFSLGNTSTLRGWNKFDLAPLGGNRVMHGSVEYRFSGLQLYYDAGSVWDKGVGHEVSHAVGFGVHGRRESNWFATFGVPIRSGRIQPFNPVFMLGIRF